MFIFLFRIPVNKICGLHSGKVAAESHRRILNSPNDFTLSTGNATEIVKCVTSTNSKLVDHQTDEHYLQSAHSLHFFQKNKLKWQKI